MDFNITIQSQIIWTSSDIIPINIISYSFYCLVTRHATFFDMTWESQVWLKVDDVVLFNSRLIHDHEWMLLFQHFFSNLHRLFRELSLTMFTHHQPFRTRVLHVFLHGYHWQHRWTFIGTRDDVIVTGFQMSLRWRKETYVW